MSATATGVHLFEMHSAITLVGGASVAQRRSGLQFNDAWNGSARSERIATQLPPQHAALASVQSASFWQGALKFFFLALSVTDAFIEWCEYSRTTTKKVVLAPLLSA